MRITAANFFFVKTTTNPCLLMVLYHRRVFNENPDHFLPLKALFSLPAIAAKTNTLLISLALFAVYSQI